MCPLGELLTRAHLDALDTNPNLPELLEVRRRDEGTVRAWTEVLRHRAECAFCRPGAAR